MLVFSRCLTSQCRSELYDNKFTTLPADTFKGLTSLSSLYVSLLLVFSIPLEGRTMRQEFG